MNPDIRSSPVVPTLCFRYSLCMYGPHYMRPCRPVRATKPAIGAGWLHEPMLDGYRLQIVKDGRTVRLYSRGGYDWTRRLEPLASALTAIRCQSAVIDAELVFPEDDDATDFAGPRAAIGSQRNHELAVFAFDLMYLDGRDLRPLPLLERRHRLERLLARSDVNCLHLVECFDDAAKLLAPAERMNLQGVVSKRRAAPYRSGECHDWMKVKTAS